MGQGGSTTTETGAYMLVLGITNNDLAGACLVEDDTVLAAVSEERFTRVKDQKVWPRRSIDFVLDHAGRRLVDVDHVAYGWCAGFNLDKHLLLYIDRLTEKATKNPYALPHLRRRIADEIANDKDKRAEFDEFIRCYGLESRAIYIDHHEAHSLGAFVCSPFDDALVLTCDWLSHVASRPESANSWLLTACMAGNTAVPALVGAIAHPSWPSAIPLSIAVGCLLCLGMTTLAGYAVRQEAAMAALRPWVQAN
jgi:hypothetical protein